MVLGTMLTISVVLGTIGSRRPAFKIFYSNVKAWPPTPSASYITPPLTMPSRIIARNTIHNMGIGSQKIGIPFPADLSGLCGAPYAVQSRTSSLPVLQIAKKFKSVNRRRKTYLKNTHTPSKARKLQS